VESNSNPTHTNQCCNCLLCVTGKVNKTVLIPHACLLVFFLFFQFRRKQLSTDMKHPSLPLTLLSTPHIFVFSVDDMADTLTSVSTWKFNTTDLQTATCWNVVEICSTGNSREQRRVYLTPQRQMCVQSILFLQCFLDFWPYFATSC